MVERKIIRWNGRGSDYALASNVEDSHPPSSRWWERSPNSQVGFPEDIRAYFTFHPPGSIRTQCAYAQTITLKVNRKGQKGQRRCNSWRYKRDIVS
jgi:hypothetical protein